MTMVPEHPPLVYWDFLVFIISTETKMKPKQMVFKLPLLQNEAILKLTQNVDFPLIIREVEQLTWCTSVLPEKQKVQRGPAMFGVEETGACIT